jgi:hypothetical protein
LARDLLERERIDDCPFGMADNDYMIFGIGMTKSSDELREISHNSVRHWKRRRCGLAKSLRLD